jgi:hypothetical protein
MSLNFQLIDFSEHYIDQYGNKSKQSVHNPATIMVKGTDEHTLYKEGNVSVRIRSERTRTDLLLRFNLFEPHDQRCVPSHHFLGPEQVANWSFLDTYLMAYEVDLKFMKDYSKKVTLHFIVPHFAELQAFTAALEDKFARVRGFKFYVEESRQTPHCDQ